VISARGDQRAVAAEHRCRDDPGEHGQGGIGCGEDVLEEHRWWVGWHQIAVPSTLPPAHQLRQDVAQAVLGDRARDGPAVVVALDPGWPAATAIEPGRSVRAQQEAPDPIGEPGQVAIVGAHLGHRKGGAAEAERSMHADRGLGFARAHGRRRLGPPFGRALDQRADSVGPLLDQHIVEVVARRRWKGNPDSSAFGVKALCGALGGAEADALAIVVGEDNDARDLGREDDLLQIARGESRPH
jgi:hypothetical protein